MIETTYARLYPDSQLRFRCYIFYKDPNAYHYIFMDTCVYEPTHTEYIYFTYRGINLFKYFTDCYKPGISVDKIPERLERILKDAERTTQKKLEDSKVPNGYTFLMAMAEAYVQMYEDIQKNVPMQLRDGEEYDG